MALGFGISARDDPQHRGPIRLQEYRMSVTESDEREILAYHWHPHGQSPVTVPHLHVSGRIPPIQIAPGEAVALADMHLPTGYVGLADVVRLLIVEFRVVPRRHDWESVLTSNE
jgi:hypothetical protein